MAEDAAQSYEPSGREFLNVIDQIAKTMFVKVAEALQPISHRLDVAEDHVATSKFQTKALNDRLLEHGQNRKLIPII